MASKIPPQKQQEVHQKIYNKLDALSKRLGILTLQVESLNKWIELRRAIRVKDQNNKTE